MKKQKAAGEQSPSKHPFNISISFNINPKNIINHQQSSNLKVSHHVYNTHSKKKQQPQSHRPKNSTEEHTKKQNSTNKKKQNKSKDDNQNSIKEIQKIKKKLFNRINNMDIILEDGSPSKERFSSNQKQPLKKSFEKRQSMMSAKMEEYKPQDISQKLSVQKKQQGKFQTCKSTFWGNKNIAMSLDKTKELSPFGQNMFKKNICKNIFTENKKNPRVFAHNKAYSTYSTFTNQVAEIKKPKKISKSETDNRSKKIKPKMQSSLKGKLSTFHFEVDKLLTYYEQNSILNTKFSSQLYNNLSKQLCKQNDEKVRKISQISQCDHQQEIKLYEYSVEKQQASQQSQVIYQQLQLNINSNNRNQLEAIKTEDIIQYYKQLSGEGDNNLLVDLHVEEVQSKNCEDEVGDQQNKISHSLSIIQNLKELIQKQPQQNYPLISKIQQALHQLKQQHLFPHNQQQQLKKTVFPASIDNQINQQYFDIVKSRMQLQNSRNLSQAEQKEVLKWQVSKKQQLIEMKNTIWKEYSKIQEIIDDRIKSESPNLGPLETCQQKKRKKMIKCLSDKILHFRRIQPEIFRQQEEQQQKQQEQYQSQYAQQSIQSTLPTTFEVHTPNKAFEAEDKQIKEHYESSSDEDHLQIHSNQPFAITPTLSSPLQQSESQQQLPDVKKVELVEATLEKEKKQQCKTLTEKYQIANDDKEDIYEFIFLDLCIQLYQEAVQQKEKQIFDENEKCPSKRILGKLTEKINSIKEKKDKKIGITTNVTAIKDYLFTLINFTLSEKRKEKLQSELALKKLNTPLGPSNTEILKSLRINVIENYNNSQEDQEVMENEQNQYLILSTELFPYLEDKIIQINSLQFSPYFDQPEKETQRINFLRNCTHVHDKAIFDSFNESLDYQRIYGIWGEPFCWKNKPIFDHQRTDLKSILENGMNQVAKSASFVCGIIADKEGSYLKGISQQSNYVKRIQEDRMFKLLESYVGQLEQKWYFYDDEEVQILLELSHIIWALLIKQVAKELQNF